MTSVCVSIIRPALELSHGSGLDIFSLNVVGSPLLAPIFDRDQAQSIIRLQ